MSDMIGINSSVCYTNEELKNYIGGKIMKKN